MPREYAPINPAILRWARERAGYSLEDVAKKVAVKVDRVDAWEQGHQPIAFGRLDKLASIYRRPSLIFYLDAPPAEEDVPVADFRSQVDKSTPPELRFQLRRANERREVALALLAEMDREAPTFAFTCSKDELVDAVGARLRAVLGIDQATQRSWKVDGQGRKALTGWKDAAERAGVLVTQASKRELGGCRGVSIFAPALPVVILSSELPRGRTFTLMHELAHLGLRQGGLCDLHDTGTEAFCNQVAAATLLPREWLLAEPTVVKRDWSNDALQALVRLYSVSEPAIVLRLVTLGLAPRALYLSKVKEYDLQAKKAAESGGGPVPQHYLALASNGRSFTQLVIDAYHQGTLTAHRAATHLGTSFKWFADIERDLVRSNLGK